MSDLKTLMYASWPEATLVAHVAALARKQAESPTLAKVRAILKDEIGMAKNTLARGRAIIDEVKRQSKIQIDRRQARYNDELLLNRATAPKSRSIHDHVRVDATRKWVSEAMFGGRSYVLTYKDRQVTLPANKLVYGAYPTIQPVHRMVQSTNNGLVYNQSVLLHKRLDGGFEGALMYLGYNNGHPVDQILPKLVRSGHSVSFDHPCCTYIVNGARLSPIDLLIRFCRAEPVLVTTVPDDPKKEQQAK